MAANCKQRSINPLTLRKHDHLHPGSSKMVGRRSCVKNPLFPFGVQCHFSNFAVKLWGGNHSNLPIGDARFQFVYMRCYQPKMITLKCSSHSLPLHVRKLFRTSHRKDLSKTHQRETCCSEKNCRPGGLPSRTCSRLRSKSERQKALKIFNQEASGGWKFGGISLN